MKTNIQRSQTNFNQSLIFWKIFKSSFSGENPFIWFLGTFEAEIVTKQKCFQCLGHPACGYKDINPIRPGFNFTALNCCLTLKRFACLQKYKLTSHEKINGVNLKKSVRFADLKILRIWDFAMTWLMKIPVTRSIFEIEGSSFGLFLIFIRVAIIWYPSI